MTKRRSDPSLAAQSVFPTAIEAEGGVMPGASESINGGAYPRADATRPATLPQAIAESMGDPTGNKNREQLLAVAHDEGIEAVATMTLEGVDAVNGDGLVLATVTVDDVDTLNRGELADALKATIPPADLEVALRS
jgi:hypothetical protein